MMKVREFAVVVEFDPETGLYIGSAPQLPGAFTQAESINELRENMREVIELVLEDLEATGEAITESEYICTEKLTVQV